MEITKEKNGVKKHCMDGGCSQSPCCQLVLLLAPCTSLCFLNDSNSLVWRTDGMCCLYLRKMQRSFIVRVVPACTATTMSIRIHFVVSLFWSWTRRNRGISLDQSIKAKLIRGIDIFIISALLLCHVTLVKKLPTKLVFGTINIQLHCDRYRHP